MTRRAGPPDAGDAASGEDDATEIYDAQSRERGARGRAKGPTRRGHEPAPSGQIAIPTPDPAPVRPASEPIQMISRKTPHASTLADAQRAPRRPPPEVRLRALSDVHKTPPRGMGRLAPPRDPREVRSRRARDLVIWGCVIVIVASCVMLAIWFLARS